MKDRPESELEAILGSESFVGLFVPCIYQIRDFRAFAEADHSTIPITVISPLSARGVFGA
jgi:hypothetical protein